MTKIIYILLWWPSWYFVHGTPGVLHWVVTEKVSSYGQNLALCCSVNHSVNDCCNEPAGWSNESKTIFIDVKKYPDNPNLKYGGTYNESGFGLIIRNLSETDVNKTYECVYGFKKSAHQPLLQEDVFKKEINVDESCNNPKTPDQCKDPMSSCTEVVSGDYKCSCNPGYYNNGGTCNIQINVDESCNNTRSPNQCKDPMSSCTEVVSGDYKCSCYPGYYNNSGTCVPDKDKDKENNTVAIVVPIVVKILVGLAIIGIKAYFVFRSRKDGNGNCCVFNRKTTNINKQKDVSGNDSPSNTEEAPLLEVVDLKEDAEKERTETSLDLWKTLTAKSSTTAVILCHREVKSVIIKANEELKKQLETFIKENKFYYNDRFLEQNSINISQGNEAVT